jgi:hypothetical protein
MRRTLGPIPLAATAAFLASFGSSFLPAGPVGDERPILQHSAHAALAQNAQTENDQSKAIEKFMKSFNEPLRFRESKPVTVNDAKFVVLGQTDWTPATPHAVFPMVAPIEIQLHITNLGKSSAIFPTCGTLGIRIINADGKEVEPRRIRNGDTLTRPVLLPGGASFSLCPRVELRWNEKAKASEAVYFDENGAQSIIGPLAPGRYKLIFWYSSMPDKGAKQQSSDATAWVGEVVTEEMLIQVLDGTTRGICTGDEHVARKFTRPLRIRESKPVTVNDAKFVVVTEADWKSGNSDKVVPVELQLRITNLSKGELIFPTFDTFGLRIKNTDGTNVIPRGGRRGTKLRQPILIPAGASYSLAAEGGAPSQVLRRAELRRDLEAKASELRYYDGTGWVSIFGPLEPGRFKLAFWYEVRPMAPFKTAWDSATWLGAVVTDDIAIEILDR